MQFIFIIAAVFLILTGSEARARDAQPILDFFVNEIDREVSRQQQRQNEKQVQKQNQKTWRNFQAAWNGCFNQSNLARCDAALSYPNLGSQDRARLLQQRAQILAAEDERSQQAKEAEAEKLAAQRAFLNDVDGCRRYQIESCERVQSSPYVTPR